MKLTDDVYLLALPSPLGTQRGSLNLSLLLDPIHGPTLFDTGLPGQLDLLAAALAEAGLALDDIRRVIVTHHDIDHIGSLHDLYERNGPAVIAHAVEAPFIDGSETPRFARPELQERNPQIRQVAELFRPTPILQRVQDGERLDLGGGVRAIFTPGHRLGHTSFYLERSKTLVAGDALMLNNGELFGSNPNATQDIELAQQSVRKLAELDVQTIVCYHGGALQEGAQEQLRRLAS